VSTSRDDKGALMRLPKKFFDGYGDKFKLPQFVGTTQKAITVYWQNHIIHRINTSYIAFDAEGSWDVLASQDDLINLEEAAELKDRVKRMKIPDIRTARKARDLLKQASWQLSDEDRTLIERDSISSVKRRQPIPILPCLRR
jgi:hypothetical protein